MKPFILFLLFGSQAFAQGVIRTEFNGVPYTCTADSSTPQNPGEGAAACAAAAYHGPFSQEQSIALCAGATSNAPADCAVLAYHGPYSLDQAITLCKSAYTTGPAECGLSAYHGAFSLDQSVRLCSFPSASTATSDCANTAYHGPYSLEQSIQLCHPGATSSKMASISHLDKSALNDLLKFVNEKAVREVVYKRGN